MSHDLPRWRFRLSSLMLWVILLALALTLVLAPWRRKQERGRLADEVEAFVQKVHEGAAAPVDAEVIYKTMRASWMSIGTQVIAYVAGLITLYLFIRRKGQRTRVKG